MSRNIRFKSPNIRGVINDLFIDLKKIASDLCINSAKFLQKLNHNLHKAIVGQDCYSGVLK